VPSVSHLAPVHLGLDVHKDTISVAILAPDRDGPDVERIAHDEASIRRLVGRFPDPRLLRACYEAGPTGYELARLLASMGVGCQVIAPSLIPKAPGDKVKTDRRDARRLARLHRAGELVAIHIPTPAEEAVRDLPCPRRPGR
jgi:transposase